MYRYMHLLCRNALVEVNNCIQTTYKYIHTQTFRQSTFAKQWQGCIKTYTFYINTDE